MKFIATVIVPILTFLIGLLTSSWWSSRSLQLQELATAAQLVSSSQSENYKGARAWAEQILLRYTAEEQTPMVESSGGFLLNDDEWYTVHNDLVDSLCLFPVGSRHTFPRPKPMVIDDSEWKEMPWKEQMLSLGEEYISLHLNYEAVLDNLDQNCGFLRHVREEMEQEGPSSGGVEQPIDPARPSQ